MPVRVNEYNIETMRALVRRGPNPDHGSDKLPYHAGANYIFRADGRRLKVTDENKELLADGLDIDYVIERQVTDCRDYVLVDDGEGNMVKSYIIKEGDIVLFNRQPSLHRMSMMAHHINVMEGRTFRFNLCDCPPYNADFDGDEMNLHVLQSDEARAEARILMQVQENILSPRYGGPIIGAIHDHITGAFFLTRADPVTGERPRFDRFQAMNIISKLDDIEVPAPSGIGEDGQPYWTGYDLFSVVLPSDLNISFKSNVGDTVKIRNGKLIEGTIDVRAIGNSKGKILDTIARNYGSDAAAKFLNQVTRIALGAIMNHGFSTGISDEDIPEDAKREIADFNQQCVDKVDDLIQSYHDGTLEQMPGRSVRETLEIEIMKTLSEARDQAGVIASKHLGMDNPAVIMAKAGSRGSMLNLSQMAGCVGQQAVRGERISRGYQGRTLPHFQRDDLGAYAKGFCSNSYKTGLTPTEFFFHAMGGREGLVDTAVRTSRSGYMQRRLVSALEDLRIMPDGSVKNTVGTIVQFKYGEDGVDPTRTVRGKAVDMNQIFFKVLGDEADKILDMIDAADKGDDYGAIEKDESGFDDVSSDEESDGEDFDVDIPEGGE